jgi:hypothetical protein
MTDSFGNKSDWIEVHNNGVTPVDLAGWKLQDGVTTWTFPSSPTWANSVLGANSYLTVFASGQDTVTLNGTQLHTNFKLSSGGDYLALLRPDNSVANEYAPQFPPQVGDISYGITESTSTTTLLTQGSAARILVPTSAAQLPADWNTNTFNESAAPWFSGTTGVGFEPAGGVLNETEPNDTTATANNASTDFVSVAATQYQMTWSGTTGSSQDWFKIGAMQAGDVLTITGSGLSSIPTDTASDNDIQLWRAGSASAVKTDTNNGPGNDPLIDHFTVTTADTYYVEIQRATSTSGGTYNVNVWLDNVSTAPTTGGTFAAEVESNDTLATANDASTSWRVVGYKSRTVGTITASDIDIYQYQFTAGDEVSINATASGGLDAQVSLKNSAGATLVKEDGTSTPNGNNTANSSIYAFKIASTGTYYLQVQSSAATTGSYTADLYLSTSNPPAAGGIVFGGLIATNVQSSMLGVNASAFVRIPFNVVDPTAINTLDLRMKYDDGFVAYLNGVEVARRNTAGTPGTSLAWNAAATVSHPNGQATVYEDFNLTSFTSLLVAGSNVLAIQGLNVLPSDTDFLVLPELDAGSDTITGTTFFSPPTPGAANTTPVAGQVATPTADKTRGFYNSAFYVTLADTTPGAQIRYTLNGSPPTATTGTIYTAPISVDQTTTLRFAAFESGYVDATVGTETYVFLGSGGANNHPAGTVLGQSNTPAGYPTNWVTTSGASTPADYGMDPTVEDNPAYSGTYDTAAALKSLPTLSLVGDIKSIFGDGTAAGGGIYANPVGDGIAFETPISVEWIDPPTALNPNGNGTSEFQVNAGLRIHGGASRNLPTSGTGTDQHALRIFFRSTYGTGTLKEPIFQDAFGGSGAVTSFDTFTLRGTYNNSWTHWDSTQRSRATYTRDEWDRDVMTAMGDQTGHGLYIQVYINGMYWGLYNLEELPEASFAASYFGGDPDADWDSINGSSTRDGSGKLPATDGTNYAWYDMINILRTEDMTSAAGYADMQKYLNMAEFADYMIDQIWAGNVDWPYHNWYADARVDRTDPNHPVPIAGGQFRFFAWDSEHILESSGQDMTNLSDSGNSDSPGEIYTKLKTNPEFQSLWADRVHRFMFNNGILTDVNAAKLFSDNLAEVDQALVAESARWGDNRRPGNPYTRNVEYIAEKNRLLGSTYDPNNPNVLPAGSYFANRNETVLAQFRSAANLLYPATGPSGSDAPEFNIQDGNSFAPGFVPVVTNPTANTPTDKIYYTLDGTDPRLAGGAISPTAIDASVTPIPALSATTHIIARRLNGTVWSASNDITIVANPNLQLKITELNYNPYAPSTGTAQDYEFVELQNTGTTPLNLSGFKFTNGVTFTFPNMVLAAGAYTVVVSNATAFQSRYGSGINIAGTYTGHFDNGGEEVALSDPLGVVLQDFTYDDSGAWPGRADGNGSSLEVVNTTGDYNSPNNWRSSVQYGGSPGSAGLGTFSDVVVNEIVANSSSPLSDAIEVYNPTASAINVGGWWLSDSSANLKKFRIPDNTTIQAGQYLDFNESDFNSPPPGNTAFSLSSLGGDVRLTAADAAGNLLRFADHVEYDASPVNVSLGRWPNGVGAFLPLSNRTFASTTGVSSATGANASPLIGQPLITEIDYNPGSSNDDREFIEIANPTANPIDISGWQLSGDVSFMFPSGTTITAFKAIVVLHFDPSHPSNAALVAAFRSAFGVSSGVPLFGPYDSVLDNGGNTVRLERPDLPVGMTTPYVLVDEATFGTQPPWPAAPNGQGASLNRRGFSSFGDVAGSWASADPTPGIFSLDITTPTASIGAVSPNPRSNPVDALAINFSEQVVGITLASLSLSRDGGPNLLASGSPTLTTSDNITWTLGNLSGLTGALGNYTLALTATGSGITDLAGNPLVNGATGSFSVIVGQWKGPTGGSFNDAANWADGTVPNMTDAVARFLFGTYGITAPAVITVDSPVTVGSIVLDSPNSYTLSGPAGITFRSSTTSQVSVLGGSHTIAMPLVLNGNITVAAGAGLTISGLQANALVIGSGGLVTIAASDSSGGGMSEAPAFVQPTTTDTANAETELTGSSALVLARGAGADAGDSSGQAQGLLLLSDPDTSLSETPANRPGASSLVCNVPTERSPSTAIDHVPAHSEGESLLRQRWIRWRRQPANSAAHDARDQALLDLLSSTNWRWPLET